MTLCTGCIFWQLFRPGVCGLRNIAAGDGCGEYEGEKNV